jgi:hypothetical protein
MHRIGRIALILSTLVLLLIGGVTPSADAQVPTPAPATTPRPDERPDACEPNNDPRRACVLPSDSVAGPFTFVPEGDVDYYSLDLGAEPTGLETTITVRATAGLDLITTITRADTGDGIAQIASPTVSTTLRADLTGWMLLRVENRAPGLAAGQSYRIEVRRTLPPVPTPIPATGPEGLERDPAEPDRLENNYSIETAAPIGVGLLYDLNFVCPVPNGCPGGDHDYLRFAAKASLNYLITTLDLAPGVDTVLELLWYDAEHGWQVVAANDDTRPGVAFLSTLRWQAPADGPVIVRVAPRSGGLQPIFVGKTSVPTYRLAVALAESDLAQQLEARIADQTGVPQPTPAPIASVPDAPMATAPLSDSGAAPVAPSALLSPTSPAITDTAGTGRAILTAAAPAYTDPDPAGVLLADLLPDTVVTLTGRVSAVWLEITGDLFVGTAWIDRRRVRPFSATATENGVAPQPAQPGSSDPTEGAAIPSGTPNIVVRPLDPIRTQPAPAAGPVQIQVQVTIETPTRPVAGMRVILTNVFGDELVAVVTDAAGSATLVALVAPDTAIEVQIPAAGVRQRVDAATPTLRVQLPEVR